MSALTIADDLAAAFKQVTNSTEEATSTDLTRALLVRPEGKVLALLAQHNSSGKADRDEWNSLLASIFSPEPNQPAYVLFRLDSRSSAGLYEWLIAAFRPEGAKVREKMQYNVTHDSLIRGLGELFFLDTVYGSTPNDFAYPTRLRNARKHDYQNPQVRDPKKPASEAAGAGTAPGARRDFQPVGPRAVAAPSKSPSPAPPAAAAAASTSPPPSAAVKPIAAPEPEAEPEPEVKHVERVEAEPEPEVAPAPSAQEPVPTSPIADPEAAVAIALGHPSDAADSSNEAARVESPAPPLPVDAPVPPAPVPDEPLVQEEIEAAKEVLGTTAEPELETEEPVAQAQEATPVEAEKVEEPAVAEPEPAEEEEEQAEATQAAAESDEPNVQPAEEAAAKFEAATLDEPVSAVVEEPTPAVEAVAAQSSSPKPRGGAGGADARARWAAAAARRWEANGAGLR